MSLKNIIYYHGNGCNDGLASMFIATLKLTDSELNAYSHGKSVIDTSYQNKTIYFLDMAPSRETYLKLKENNTVIILDHHISNMKEYLPTDNNVFFDMNKSGVGMTWTHFFPDSDMPYFLKLIQARDLYKLDDYPETREFSEGLQFTLSSNDSLEENIFVLNELYENPSKIQYYINIGKLLLKQKTHKIKHLTEKYIKQIYNYNNYKVCMANVEYDLVSDLGNSLSSQPECDIAILWRYDHTTHEYSISMRSNNKVDVSEICKQFGGGGHKNAAGCSLKNHPIDVFKNKCYLLKQMESSYYMTADFW